jgi:hypothetical protein
MTDFILSPDATEFHSTSFKLAAKSEAAQEWLGRGVNFVTIPKSRLGDTMLKIGTRGMTTKVAADPIFDLN